MSKPNITDLVESHDRLACKRAHVLHRKLPYGTIEIADLLQIAREGLVEAAYAWNPKNDSKASFATFAYYRVNGALVDHIRTVIGRYGQRLGLVNARSFDAAMTGTRERTLLDNTSDYTVEREYDDIEGIDCIQRAEFDEREAVIAAGVLNDVPFKDLARQLGISQSSVSLIVKKMQAKMIEAGMAPVQTRQLAQVAA